MVELDGYLGLFACAKHLLEAEIPPISRCVGDAGGEHLFEGSLVDERWI